MSTDWRDAAERHFDDGIQLENNARYANADHLFGVSTECALKAVMLGIGHPKATSGDWPDGHKTHIDVLWTGFQSFASGLFEAKYAAYLSPSNPFATWSVNQRYWARHHFSKTSVAPHMAAATDCNQLLKQLILDGVF